MSISDLITHTHAKENGNLWIFNLSPKVSTAICATI